MFNSVWYYNLTNPPLSPPDWLFTPVWIILYITILVAFVFYYKTPNPNKKSGYLYFMVQALLNILWTPVFFGMENITLGLAVILLLDIFVLLTIIKFYSVSKISAYILIPYFLWILFATYLNLGYLILN